MKPTEYTVQQLAKLAGVSVRTLHWYDSLGLLHPQRVSPAGYRLYGPREVDVLQDILFYRALGVPLKHIAALRSAPAYDRLQALQAHRTQLAAEQQRLETLLSTLDKTILLQQGEITMTDKEKFEGLRRSMVEKNEAEYGKEARQRYGQEAVEASNAKMMGLSQQQFEAMQALGAEINAALEAAVQAGAQPEAEQGRRIAQMHKEWLGYTWPKYTAAAHRGLAQMYVADERFTAYYDSAVPGCAQFLCDAICAFAQ